MGEETRSQDIAAFVEELYHLQSRKVFATLIRLLGDFDLAEEALHEAFAAAVKKWAEKGIPANPSAWLISTGRFKAIDAIRRRVRFDSSISELALRLEKDSSDFESGDILADDRLRLIFTCCHPAIAPSAQVALTLREICGLTTEQIASAFLLLSTTMTSVRVRNGKRLVTDGPFAETSEQLGGYFLVEAKDLDESLEIARQIPGARKGTVEVRPIIELSGLSNAN